MKHCYGHIILFILLSFFARSQEYSYYSFNELYQFDVGTIYDIDQDQQGDYWFGTSEGLIHFNGRDFRRFSSKNYAKDVTNIKFDKSGRVWCSNFGGQLFYVENDSLHTAVHETPGSGYIRNYFPSQQDEIIVFSDKSKSILRINLTTQKSTTVWKMKESGWILDVFEKDNQLLLLTQKRNPDGGEVHLQQFSLDPRSNKVTFLKENRTNYTSPAQFSSYYNDSLYFTTCTKQGITSYNLSREDVKLFSKVATSFDINNVIVHNNQAVALRKTGVVAFDLTPPYNENLIISSKNASCMFEDNTGNLWVGTLDDGIFIVPNLAIRKTHFNRENVKSIAYTIDKTLYFVTEKGNFCTTPYPYSEYHVISSGFTPSEVMVYDPHVETIFFTNHPQVYDVKQQKLRAKNGYEYFKDIHFLNNNLFITTKGHTAILKTKNGAPIVDEHLVCDYNFRGARRDKNLAYKDRMYLRDVRSLHIVEDKDKAHLYINYIDGLYHYSHENTPEEIIFNQKPVLASTLIEDTHKGVWVGTNDGYLIKLEKGKKVFQKKLPESIRRIAQNKHVLFLYSHNKIYRLDTKTKALSSLGLIDGVDPSKVSTLFCHNDSLFIIGASTVQRIATTYSHINTYSPSVSIDAIKLYDEPIQFGNQSLAYNENQLSFYFHAMDIRSQQNYKYEYRITKGAEWITLSGSAREVTLTNLEPGNYNFQIRAINIDGRTSDIKNYPFTIDKHFSQKLWFNAIVFLIISAVIGLIIRYRYRSLQQKNKLQAEQEQLKKEVYKSKIAAIRSQMNPHFMFNALNTIQEFIITNQKSVASEYLADFADLMRKYLEQSKYEEITMNEEIETLEIYLGLENLRFDDELAYSIHTEPTVNPYDTTIPVMLLQPFVENAIKHGLLHKTGKKTLTIRFSKIGSRIQCIIEDNGIGRKASLQMKKGQAHLSFATSAIDQKADLVNKNSNRNIEIQIIDLTDGDSSNGTRVHILFDL